MLDYEWAFSFRQIPVSQDYLKHLACELAYWADTNEDALVFSEFFHDRKPRIPKQSFYEWVKKNQFLADAHKYALEAIGNRREKGALKKKLDANTVIKSMPIYSEEWKELNEWYGKMKTENESHGDIHVHYSPTEIEDVQKPKT